MTTETRPAGCPFCEDGGKPFAERIHEPVIGFAVICHACKSRGPAVKMDPEALVKRGATWESVTAPLREQAVKIWNKRSLAGSNWLVKERYEKSVREMPGAN